MQSTGASIDDFAGGKNMPLGRYGLLNSSGAGPSRLGRATLAGSSSIWGSLELSPMHGNGGGGVCGVGQTTVGQSRLGPLPT